MSTQLESSHVASTLSRQLSSTSPFLGPMVTANQFPHVTIAAALLGPYSAVYSNVLWARFSNTSPLHLTYGPSPLPPPLSLTSSLR